jgi:hypothetical protein
VLISYCFHFAVDLLVFEIKGLLKQKIIIIIIKYTRGIWFHSLKLRECEEEINLFQSIFAECTIHREREEKITLKQKLVEK